MVKMRRQSCVFVLHVLVLCTWPQCTVDSLFLPFGASAGDTGESMPYSTASVVNLPSNVTFYGDSYATIYANVDGLISFTQAASVYDVDGDFSSVTLPVICVFCALFAPNTSSQVWHRWSTDATQLQTIQDLAVQYNDFGADFTPAWLFVVTWDNVFKFSPDTPLNAGNTIQAVVASDGTKTFVLFEFDTITWLEGFSGTTTINTKVGFNKGDTTSFYTFPESRSQSLAQLNATSNIGLAGHYLFRVDQSTISSSPTLVTTTLAPPTTTTAATTTTPTTTPTTTSTSTTTAAPTTTTAATTTTPTTTPTTTSTSTTTAAPTTTTAAPTTTTAVSINSETTQAATASTEAQARSSSFDATPYYIGFGVAGGGLLTIAVVVVAVVAYNKRSSPLSILPSTPVKVAPAPGHAPSNGLPPSVTIYPVTSTQVLKLGTPFKIPRPSSSLSSSPSTTTSHLASASSSSVRTGSSRSMLHPFE